MLGSHPFRQEQRQPAPAPASAREMVAAALGHDPRELLHDLDEAGERKAKAEGVAYQLEHLRKIVLAQIMGDIEAEMGGKVAEGRLERLARADARYAAQIAGTAEAITQRERAAAEYWRIKAEMELDNATLTHANAAMRLAQ